jgi:hypothetical protein
MGGKRKALVLAREFCDLSSLLLRFGGYIPKEKCVTLKLEQQ